jgi:hypothetical protein
MAAMNLPAHPIWAEYAFDFETSRSTPGLNEGGARRADINRQWLLHCALRILELHPARYF